MYMRARDHCTSSKHIVQLCLSIIKVGAWGLTLSEGSVCVCVCVCVCAAKYCTHVYIIHGWIITLGLVFYLHCSDLPFTVLPSV